MLTPSGLTRATAEPMFGLDKLLICVVDFYFTACKVLIQVTNVILRWNKGLNFGL